MLFLILKRPERIGSNSLFLLVKVSLLATIFSSMLAIVKGATNILSKKFRLAIYFENLCLLSLVYSWLWQSSKLYCLRNSFCFWQIKNICFSNASFSKMSSHLSLSKLVLNMCSTCSAFRNKDNLAWTITFYPLVEF